MSRRSPKWLLLSLSITGSVLLSSGCYHSVSVQKSTHHSLYAIDHQKRDASQHAVSKSEKNPYRPGYGSLVQSTDSGQELVTKKEQAEQALERAAEKSEVRPVSFSETAAVAKPKVPTKPKVAPSSFQEVAPVSPVAMAPAGEPSEGVSVVGGPLTLEEVLSYARTNSPAISEIQARVDALGGKLVQAGLRPNPTVGINGEDINESGGAGRYGVYYSQRVVRGGKLERSQQVVEAEIQVAHQQLATAEAKVRTDARTLFYDLLIATEKEKLTKKLVEISESVTTVSRKLFEAKESSKTVLLQSEIELQNARVLQSQAKNQRIAAQIRLDALIGKEAAGRAIQGEVKTGWEVLPQTEALDQLIQQNPLIHALEADIQRANQVVCRQSVEAIGDVTWQTNLMFDTVNDDLIAGFQVGLPIPRNNANQGAIHQAKQMVISASQKLEKQKLKLKIDLTETYQNYRDAEIQIRAYQQRILPLAQETLNLVNEGYRQGETNFLQLLTAQRTYFQTNLQYYDQLRKMWQRKNEIDGMLLKGSLDN